jgi:hypothetical protein
MSPLSYVALYCSITWIIGALVVRTFPDDCEQAATLSRWQPYAPWRALLGWVAAVLLVSPFLPLVIGYCLLQCYREARAWRKFSRTHRDHVFERMHPVNLPKSARDYITEQMRALESLGFADLGTYLLKPEPLVIHGRCFQSCEGTVVAVLMHMSEENNFSLTTVFENGHVLETSSIESSSELERVNQSGRFHAVFAGDIPFEEALDRHLETVAELEQRHETVRLAFTPTQFQEVMHYENRLFGEWLYETGRLDAPPPPTIRPNGTAETADYADHELASVT